MLSLASELVGMEHSAPAFLPRFQEQCPQTLVVNSGDDAFEAARRLSPDLVVIRSAEETSATCLELVRELRADRGVGRILVLLPGPVTASTIA